MPLPKLNDLLPPFFDFLADGKPHSDYEIARNLAVRFRVNSVELEQTTPSGMNRFDNLVAWCKAHATMAQFMQRIDDGLQLTPLGISEVKKGTQRITVGYLTSFKRR